MEQNSLIDVVKVLSGKNSFNADMRQIRLLIQNYFNNKYISKINSAISSEILKQKTSPSNAMKLLYALKPYTASSTGSAFMDNIIEAAAAAGAISALSIAMPSQGQRAAAATVNDPCIKKDGVYEIDADCRKPPVYSAAAKPDPLIFAIILLLLANNVSA